MWLCRSSVPETDAMCRVIKIACGGDNVLVADLGVILTTMAIEKCGSQGLDRVACVMTSEECSITAFYLSPKGTAQPILHPNTTLCLL